MLKITRQVTLLLLAGALSFPAYSYATQATEVLVPEVTQEKVTGTVEDALGPVIGASVMVKGTTNGVITDLEGKFSLNDVKKGDIIVISYIGYVTQEIPYTGKPIQVKLAEDSKALEEVVVVGYATVKKANLTGAVSAVDGKVLEDRPIVNLGQGLQGAIPNLNVTTSGRPGQGSSFNIRGTTAMSGSSPLVLVDGVEMDPNLINPQDVKSVSVLKDAASAAIYGAQSGAGGVILVTTKKAKAGIPTLSYEGTYGIRQATNLPEPLNAEEELEMRKRSYANANVTLPDGWNIEKNPWIGTTRTNWMDEIFRTAFYQRHNIALNVGTDNYSSRLSFSFDNDEGVLINTYNKNYAIRYNGKFDLNKWVSISEDLVWKNTENRSKDTNDAYTGPVLSAIYMPASATVYNPLDGTWGGTTTEDPEYIAKYGSNFAGAHGDAVNPVRLLRAENRFNRTSDVWSTTSLQIANIIQGLKFTSRFTYNLKTNNYKNFRPIQDEPGKPNNSNSLDVTNYRTDAWKTENTLTYDNSFGNHTVGALFSTTADHYNVRGLKVNGKNFADESPYLQYLAYAGTTSATDYLTGPDANVSLVARLAYSYDDRYFVTASWRRDYAGRLPKENNFGDFPAATLAWKISNERFFKKSDFIGMLKLRASWGRVGNLGSIDYNYKSLLLGTSYWQEQAQYGVINNATWNNFVYNSTAMNRNLTWETSEQWDLGLDVELFKNRLALSFDYFDKRTFNLIQKQTMNWPSSIGLDPLLINQGEIRNRGIEIQANWNDRVNKDFSYFVSGNFSYLKNWVSDIGVKNADGSPGVWTDSDSKFRNIPYTRQTAEGEPLNSYYLIKTDGIFQSDAEAAAYVDKNGKRIQPNAVAGDLKFIDYNNDGKIDDKDRQYCGSATPKTTYSFSFGATYKKFSFSAMFQGVGGAQAFYAAKSVILSDADGNFNRVKDILNAWSPTNTSSNIPRLSMNDPNSNFSTASDWYLESASYLRLKNLTLSYDLTDVLQKWSHLRERNSRMSVYFSGENLFTITDYSGMDPECGGWDAMKYPVSRVFSFGVKLTY